jgi:hypothetical protein
MDEDIRAQLEVLEGVKGTVKDIGKNRRAGISRIC